MRSQVNIKTNRLFIGDSLSLGKQISVDDLEIFNYLVNVLRLKPGRQIRVFNQKDGEFLAELQSIGKKNLLLDLKEILATPQPVKTKLIAGISILKPATMLQSVNIATQLGVDIICPVITERCQSIEVNYDKCNKHIIQASEQCERLTLPEMKKAKLLDDFLKEHDNIFVANEHNIGRVDPNLSLSRNELITVLVGPEGGFSPKEVAKFSAPNIHSVKIADNILKAEIALAVLIAQVEMARL